MKKWKIVIEIPDPEDVISGLDPERVHPALEDAIVDKRAAALRLPIAAAAVTTAEEAVHRAKTAALAALPGEANDRRDLLQRVADQLSAPLEHLRQCEAELDAAVKKHDPTFAGVTPLTWPPTIANEIEMYFVPQHLAAIRR